MASLNDGDLQALGARWIPPELAEAAGIYRVESADGAAIIGRKGSGDYAGLAIPYTWPGAGTRETQLRLDHPELEIKRDGTTKPKAKYLLPPGRSNILYVPDMATAGNLDDSQLPIIITEGAFKVLALWRMATSDQETPRYLPLGLTGVWSWRGTVGKQAGADGSRQAVKGPIPDLARITWQGRRAYILFDSDAARNKSVQAAARGLAGELKSRGAEVYLVDLPDLADLEKTGADDYLAHPDGGPERLLERISAAREYEPDLLRYGMHDVGNSERLLAHLKQEIRYCYPARKWLYYAGTHWEWDTSGYLRRRAKLVMTEYHRQALIAHNEAHETFSRRSLDSKRIENALSLAQCELPIEMDELDRDPYSLNVLNGTVDCRSGALRPHLPEDYITRVIPFRYDPQAKCAAFLVALYRMMGLEQSEERSTRLVHFMQTALGYSLVGVTSEKVVFLCHGAGDNGKTTLLELIREIIGPYSASISTESLMSKNLSNNELADLANLRGARFVRSSETEQGQRLNEARLKRITQGMGIIRACKKYEDWFEFPESHTLWIDANHRPVVRGQDPAIWNRLALIPFEVTIPKAEQDPNLRQKLLAEAEGVLAWMIQGAVRWCAERLHRPEEVTSAVDAWRTDSDPLADYLAECCELDPTAWVSSGALWDSYAAWAEHSGIDPLTRTVFGLRITGLGCHPGRRKVHGSAIRSMEGIRIRGGER